MQNIILKHFTSSKMLKCFIILFTIASILACIACSLLENSRFYFVADTNGSVSLNSQYMASSSVADMNFAGEETIRSANASYSSFLFSTLRTQRISQNFLSFLCAFLLVAILIFTNTLRFYGYKILPTQGYSSIRIAGFIEHSDGKK